MFQLLISLVAAIVPICVEHRPISATHSARHDWVELAVADTGIGLTTEQQAKAVPGLHSG
jgi:signal transduction histidine kinase